MNADGITQNRIFALFIIVFISVESSIFLLFNSQERRNKGLWPLVWTLSFISSSLTHQNILSWFSQRIFTIAVAQEPLPKTAMFINLLLF
jgi:hypothetical protein